MNFFSYLGKSKDSEQAEEGSSSLLEEKQLSVVNVRKNYTKRIKKLLYADSTKENLSDNEFLPYIYYDVKLNEFLYKTVFFGLGCAIFGRIMIKKLKINLTTRESLWFDLLGFSTCFNYLYFNEYPKLNDTLFTRLGKEEEDELKQNRDKDYETERLKLVSNYRAKFYTDSQFWH